MRPLGHCGAKLVPTSDPDDGSLFSHRRKRKQTPCQKLKFPIVLSKLDKKGHLLHDSTYMKSPEESNSERQLNSGGQKLGGGEMG